MGDEYLYVNLLFFNWQQLQFFVVDLKAIKVDAQGAVQLRFYVVIIDDQMRMAELHAPGVGILLVADKNETVAKYAPTSSTRPVTVSCCELHPPQSGDSAGGGGAN